MTGSAWSRFRFLILVVLLISSMYAAHKTSSCAICPVAAVQPKASTPLGDADPSHGCTMQTKRGFPVPDPKCTPGAFNPSVTVQVLKDPKFRTACLRDCVTTQSDKSVTYRQYGIPHPKNNQGPNQVCELDHLVPLEIGGADTLDNIWPQCGPNHVALAKRYFKQKDIVESYLANQVKTGEMDLAKAQAGIAADWTQFLSIASEFCSKNPTKCNGNR